MIAEAFVALEGLKQVFGIAQSGIATNTQQQINQAIIDIQKALLDAQAAAFEDNQTQVKLIADVAELKREIASFQAWETEKARYILTKSELGTYTYELNPESANGEPQHRLCVNCFVNGKKSILHGTRVVNCQSCGNSLSLQKSSPINVRRSQDW